MFTSISNKPPLKIVNKSNWSHIHMEREHRNYAVSLVNSPIKQSLPVVYIVY